MTLAAIGAAVATEHLAIRGHAALTPEDGLPAHLHTILLLGPDEPRFWPHFHQSPEAQDGQPHPLDRWSRRVIGRLACAQGAKACFPFGGPPYRPFIAWALRSGRAHQSPVGLLVHPDTGLFFSLRGAIAIPDALPPDPTDSPCTTCAGKPCLAACPVSALTASGYDVPACHAFLDTAPGKDCMDQGCAVRRACPVGSDRRLPAQSAFHMKAFHP
jgi:epoxyqueuosine reductase